MTPLREAAQAVVDLAEQLNPHQMIVAIGDVRALKRAIAEADRLEPLERAVRDAAVAYVGADELTRDHVRTAGGRSLSSKARERDLALSSLFRAVRALREAKMDAAVRGDG